MLEKEQELIKILQGQMLCFMFDARESVKLIFSDYQDKEIRCLAILTRAINYLAYSKSIYNIGIDDHRDDIDNVLTKADIFIKEITNNIATNHSHQWSDIQYRELAKAYDNSVLCDNSEFSTDY